MASTNPHGLTPFLICVYASKLKKLTKFNGLTFIGLSAGAISNFRQRHRLEVLGGVMEQEGSGRERRGEEGRGRERKGEEGRGGERKGEEGRGGERKGEEGRGRERKGEGGRGRERKRRGT